MPFFLSLKVPNPLQYSLPCLISQLSNSSSLYTSFFTWPIHVTPNILLTTPQLQCIQPLPLCCSHIQPHTVLPVQLFPNLKSEKHFWDCTYEKIYLSYTAISLFSNTLLPALLSFLECSLEVPSSKCVDHHLWFILDLFHCVSMVSLQLKLHLEDPMCKVDGKWWSCWCRPKSSKIWKHYERVRCHDGAPNCHRTTVQVVCAKRLPQRPQNVTVDCYFAGQILGDKSQSRQCRKKYWSCSWSHSWPALPPSVLETVDNSTTKTAVWSLGCSCRSNLSLVMIIHSYISIYVTNNSTLSPRKFFFIPNQGGIHECWG